MRAIITGISGWFARNIAASLSKAHPDIEIIGLSRSTEPHDLPVRVISNTDYFERFEHQSDDVIVHCAFCRRSDGAALVESLEFSSRIFEKACAADIAGIVNISSQSVYHSGGLTNDETTPRSPAYLYALAKAASEILLEAIAHAHTPHIAYTDLRMASLVGASSDTYPNNVLSTFINNALAGEPIRIVGGEQRFSFLNIHDAAGAVIKLLEKDPFAWNPVYNIGPGDQTLISDMAYLISKTVAERTGENAVPVFIKKQPIELDAGMNSELARRELGWRPHKSIEDTVCETLDLILKEGKTHTC